MIKQFAGDYLTKLTGVIEHIPLDHFERVVNIMQGAYEQERKIFIMGNGGSGSTASHFSCDINKGVSYGLEKRFKVICLNDNIPTMLAYANDQSYDDIFVEQLTNLSDPGDLVIGISASGNSKNVIKAIQYANETDLETIAFTGFDGGALARIAKLFLNVSANDMQKIEDVHLILTHIIMQVLYEKLRRTNSKAEFLTPHELIEPTLKT